MHNQEVIFNENDRSIESQCCIFNGKKVSYSNIR